MTLPTNHNLFSLVFLVTILCSSLFLTTTASESKGEEYIYTKGARNGPENWGSLKPEWEVCRNGKSQSPIDIKNVEGFSQLGKLKKDYKVAPATLKNRGHDIMLQWDGDAGKLNINGTYYKFVQSHWHTPSEHTLNGSKFDMEMHAVHENSKGERAVIGIWYTIGQPDPLLSKLLDNIKLSGDNKDIDLGILNPGLIKFGSRKYYRYVGSLTTPPCSEGVIWTIVKKVRTVSREQLKALKEAVHDGFEINARPTQELNGRKVWLYTPNVV
ncbi:alpha carbonic anhydrase 4-like isoform X1 [Lotus japonicus]|uniref:Carbonic anhydrase n=1 Tax=Lotus japonicus TaxID=34305 RepID=A7DX12_LOTJA|nr:alpha carbonic anhydrase 4-like isoform X1 [Lotus japonicus]CAM59682.1 a-type carbonic anhydrase [Lotus japonicus]